MTVRFPAGTDRQNVWNFWSLEIEYYLGFDAASAVRLLFEI